MARKRLQSATGVQDSIRPEFGSLADLGKALQKKLQSIVGTERPCFLTNEAGRAEVVVLDVQHYNFLMDLIEESSQPTAEDEARTESRQILQQIIAV
ncbi:MAG TPA: hypothetical protein VL860_11015 [Planctomycetota bacterium]|nr:hypothetical protein [Planctomycetota bacterium]